MLADIGVCPNCGASGKVGESCDYCKSIIVSPNYNYDENHSITSWSDFRFDGFSLKHENIEGNTDFPDCYVIEGDRTGKQGLINRFGKVVIPCIYDTVTAYLDYNLCCVSKDLMHGVIDFNGKTVIPLRDCGMQNLLVIQYGYIVGFNSVYDLNGNLKTGIPSEERIVLTSSDYTTTYPDGKALYNIETGEMLLSSKHKVEKHLDDDLFLVNSFIDGATRYGIYKADSKEFLLPCECLSIQYQEDGMYVARIQSSQEESITKMRTLTFSVANNSITILKEENQVFQNGSHGGCMVALAIATTLPLLTYLLL